jgi:hypothetical protein
VTAASSARPRTAHRPACALLAAATALAAAALGPGCSSPSPEQRIRALIAAGEARAEAKDVRGLLDLVAANYADDAGRERRDLGPIVAFALQQYERVFLYVRIDTIEITGESTAEATLFVAIAGTEIADPAELPRLTADLGRVALRFAAGGEFGYEVVSADWEPAGLADFLVPPETRS